MAMIRIDTTSGRRALKPRRDPYWHKITEGRYVGFRRSERGGTWIARLWDKDANRQRFSALEVHHLWDSKDAFQDAFSKALDWYAQAERVEDHQYTVADAFDEYIDHLRVNNSEASARGNEARLRKHVPEKLRKTQLTRLKTVQVKRWHQSLVRLSDDAEDVRKSKDTANRTLTTFRAALNLAFRSGLVATDREWRRVQPFKNVGMARKLFLTDEQVKRLLEHTTGGLHNLIRAGVLTGARYGELANAKVSDVDGGTLYLTGKTGPRDCYLSDEAAAFFKALTRNRLPNAWLLVKDNGDPWGKWHHIRLIRRVVRAAMLPRDAVFYSLRHYHISKALIAGVPAQVLAENVGTSVKMLESHYAKFLEADRRSALNKIVLG